MQCRGNGPLITNPLSCIQHMRGEWRLELFESTEVSGVEKKENGCPTWTRTRNQVINSHLLYH